MVTSILRRFTLPFAKVTSKSSGYCSMPVRTGNGTATTVPALSIWRRNAVTTTLHVLENARAESRKNPAFGNSEDHPIHIAAQAGDVRRVRELLDGDPSLVYRGDRAGGTPLHRAAAGSAREVISLLLDRGADIHAIHGVGLGCFPGFAPYDVQAIDIALWGGFGRRPRPPLWRILVRLPRYFALGPIKTRRLQPTIRNRRSPARTRRNV